MNANQRRRCADSARNRDHAARWLILWFGRVACIGLAWVLAIVLATQAATANADYVFGWPFQDSTKLEPRGGNTRGPDVVLATEPGAAWQTLRQPGLNPRERDRRAILAMAGDFRASFDFLESLVFSPGQGPARPYRSWGTERIYVVEDDGNTIGLQHVIVMFTVVDGVRQGPFVQKHWRQDWRYEPAFVMEHRGHARWERRTLSRAERKGAWAQDVYQVDDAPRYSSVGRWRHTPAASMWLGSSTWRPLPRREFTVRDDYDVLEGINRVNVLPLGWVHEQDNLKLVLDEHGQPSADGPYRARELGIDRYERITDFDFSAGDAYWQKTHEFWQVLRNAWTNTLHTNASLSISDDCNEQPAFEIAFAYAEQLQNGETATNEDYQRIANEVMKCTVHK